MSVALEVFNFKKLNVQCSTRHYGRGLYLKGKAKAKDLGPKAKDFVIKAKATALSSRRLEDEDKSSRKHH